MKEGNDLPVGNADDILNFYFWSSLSFPFVNLWELVQLSTGYILANELDVSLCENHQKFWKWFTSGQWMDYCCMVSLAR